jgi:hypothetical protein
MDYLISEKTGEVKTAQEWIEESQLHGWDFSKADLTPVIPDGRGGWYDKGLWNWDETEVVLKE